MLPFVIKTFVLSIFGWPFYTGSTVFSVILLTVPRRYFFCGYFMFLFCLVFAMSLCASNLYVLCGHLLGKG